MSGGAINWGNLWSGLKNFGSSFGSNIKTWGSKAWNSSTGQALREKLKDTGVQEKIIDGISSGIHGAIDLTRQELDRALANRLERPKEVMIEEKPPSETVIWQNKPVKRPAEPEETLVITTKEPPSYNEIFGNNSAPIYPTTRPHPSLARPVLPPITDKPTTLDLPPPPANVSPPQATIQVAARPSRRVNWQGTLNKIVGLGVHSSKRQRCY